MSKKEAVEAIKEMLDFWAAAKARGASDDEIETYLSALFFDR